MLAAFPCSKIFIPKITKRNEREITQLLVDITFFMIFWIVFPIILYHNLLGEWRGYRPLYIPLIFQERKTRASNRKSKDLTEINISNTAEAPALETPSKRPTRGCRKTPVSQPKEAEAPALKRVTRKEAFKPLEEDLKVEPEKEKEKEKEKGDSFQEMLKQLKEDQSKRKERVNYGKSD